MGSSTRTILLITLLLISSLALIPYFVSAASGGRMGGDSFSDDDDSSSSSSSFDYHHHHYDGHTGKDSLNEADPRVICLVIVIIVLFILLSYWSERQKSKRSLIMIQVGLTDKGSSLKKQLNEIAKTTNTSSSKGWNHILTRTKSALLNRPHNFIFGYSSVKQHMSTESLEKNFRQLSEDERNKTDIESLVNVNGIRQQREVIPTVSKLGKDYIVVTILIAARGFHKVSAIKSSDDLKGVLQSLTFPSEKLVAVEVLWTPQDENDTLLEDELLEDYPLLRPI